MAALLQICIYSIQTLIENWLYSVKLHHTAYKFMSWRTKCALTKLNLHIITDSKNIGQLYKVSTETGESFTIVDEVYTCVSVKYTQATCSKIAATFISNIVLVTDDWCCWWYYDLNYQYNMLYAIYDQDLHFIVPNMNALTFQADFL